MCWIVGHHAVGAKREQAGGFGGIVDGPKIDANAGGMTFVDEPTRRQFERARTQGNLCAACNERQSLPHRDRHRCKRCNFGLRHGGITAEATPAHFEQCSSLKACQRDALFGAMAMQQFKHTADHRRLGLFEIDVEAHVWACSQRFFEGRNANALASEWACAVGRNKAPA